MGYNRIVDLPNGVNNVQTDTFFKFSLDTGHVDKYSTLKLSVSFAYCFCLCNLFLVFPKHFGPLQHNGVPK